MDKLLKLAKKTAREIRSRSAIPGWHEAESKFPECSFDDVVSMLSEAYRSVVVYRDEVGIVAVEVDGDGVSFSDGMAYFSDGDREYRVPVANIESVK